MPTEPDQPDDADAVLERAEVLARSVLALKGKTRRSAVSATLRRKIGERDGWICGVCREPVDPDLKWSQPDLAAIAGHEVHLAGWNPTGVAELLAWVGDDPDRAGTAYAWSQGVGWKDRASAQALAKARATHPRWPSELYPALRKVMNRRVRNNAEYGTVEHLIPVSMGGGNTEANLAIAHKRCNTKAGAPGSTNGDLLEAPRTARRVLADLALLRDAREVDPAVLAHLVGHLVDAARRAGLEADDGLEAGVLAAATGFAVEFGGLWRARYACVWRVAAFEHLFRDIDFTRYLGAEVRAADRKLKTLVRADAIERWQARRTVAAGLLPRAQANPSFLHDTLEELRGMSGRAHDAAWWEARRDEFPKPHPGLTADFGLSMRESGCPYCNRRTSGASVNALADPRVEVGHRRPSSS